MEMEDYENGIEKLDNQIDSLHNQLRDLYGCVFPELEYIVVDKVKYARLLIKLLCIGRFKEEEEEDDDLSDLLPPATILVINIMISSSSSSSSKTTSSTIDSDKTIELCNQILTLASQKQKLMDSLETTMLRVAPNLSALVGTMIASKLIGVVFGGISGLANMPCCNLLCLGAPLQLQTNKTSIAFSSLDRVGYIQESDIIQCFTPPPLRLRACRLLAAKSILAARVDFATTDPFGNYGKKMREEIVDNIQKWQKPHPAKIVKPLVVPQFDKPKKKRGGRRLRKTKERYAMTALRTRANRVQFGIPEETSLWS